MEEFVSVPGGNSLHAAGPGSSPGLGRFAASSLSVRLLFKKL